MTRLSSGMGCVAFIPTTMTSSHHYVAFDQPREFPVCCPNPIHQTISESLWGLSNDHHKDSPGSLAGWGLCIETFCLQFAAADWLMRTPFVSLEATVPVYVASITCAKWEDKPKISNTTSIQCWSFGSQHFAYIMTIHLSMRKLHRLLRSSYASNVFLRKR